MLASPHSPSELVLACLPNAPNHWPAARTARTARTSLVKSSKVNLGSPLGMRTWGYEMAEMVLMNPPNSKLAGY